MDAEPQRPRRRFRAWLLIPLLALVGSAVGWRVHEKKAQADSIKNYVLAWPTPGGWNPVAHGPQTLFKFQDPRTKLVIRGAANQMVADVNPTPELDTDGIADYYMDRTDENMRNWKATKLGAVAGKDVPFAVIRRSTKDRVIVTAYAVRGNTTVLVSLIGLRKAMAAVDPNMAMFNAFLGKLSLTEKDMTDL